MTTTRGYRPYTSAPVQRPGLGIASLVLALAALPLAALCGLGLLPALAGLGLGIIAVRRSRGRTQGLVGIVASAVALALSAAVLAWFLDKAAKCGDLHQFPDRAARVRCVEREFPMVEHRAGY